MIEPSQHGDNQVERLLNRILLRRDPDDLLQLRAQFEASLNEFKMTSFQAEKQLGIDYKTLNRLLNGELKKFDLITLIKLGYFLRISEKDISDSFICLMIEQHAEELALVKKIMFIRDNFDLDTLKKLKIISKPNDFNAIEQELISVLGLRSLLEYNPDDIYAAHSETNVKPRHQKNRNYFKDKSRTIFKHINNPNPFDRQGLIDYFPKIRWHSTDISNGMINVMKSLFKLGVTVIFQPKIPLLQMRGATFAVNGKPCIVLTDYRNSYPTLWFAFLHELFHVLFDWDEILQKKYHFSDEETDLDVLKHKEVEANDFAREYLFPQKKTACIAERIRQGVFIMEYAKDHHVHSSIVYANFAHSYSDSDHNYWSIYNSQMNPDMSSLIQRLSDGLTHKSPPEIYAANYLKTIYN